jgi:hypothetical protein
MEIHHELMLNYGEGRITKKTTRATCRAGPDGVVHGRRPSHIGELPQVLHRRVRGRRIQRQHLPSRGKQASSRSPTVTASDSTVAPPIYQISTSLSPIH